MNEDIRQGYNKIAKNYTEGRDVFKSLPYLEKFNSLLKPHSKILDIGCGGGMPVDQYFAEKGHKVTGLDISDSMIEIAKSNVPEAIYAQKDMTELELDEYQVDAAVSFYAIFHTPRNTHLETFKKINSFLPVGGLILVSLGATDWEGTEEFFGSEMSWSHFGKDQNIRIIQDAGFEIIESSIDTSGNEKHLFVIAKKI